MDAERPDKCRGCRKKDLSAKARLRGRAIHLLLGADGSPSPGRPCGTRSAAEQHRIVDSIAIDGEAQRINLILRGTTDTTLLYIRDVALIIACGRVPTSLANN